MKKRLLLVAVVVGLAAALPNVALAQATVTQFTGTEEACVVLNWGDWTFPDGNIHIRGLVLTCQEVTDTPLYGGTNLIVVNANLRAQAGAFLGGVGPIWGTFLMDNWSGTWEGESTPTAGAAYHAQGQGSGANAGMKMWLTTASGRYDGRILDPHGK